MNVMRRQKTAKARNGVHGSDFAAEQAHFFSTFFAPSRRKSVRDQRGKNICTPKILHRRNGLIFDGMKTTDSDSQNAAAAPPRRRGAPKGNRNAWKHGKRSAAAKAARAAKRERLMRLLPDAGVFVRAAAPSDPQGLGCDGELERILSNAKNRSAGPNRGEGPPSPFFDGQNEQFGCVAKKGEGDPPPHFSTNKANNSAAAGAKRPRGAPKGNSNALKHGFRSGKRREFGAALRIFLYRVDATSRLANSMANVRKIR